MLGSACGTCGKMDALLTQALEAYSQAVKWGGGREYFVRMARLYHDLGRQEEALQASQR